MFRFLKLLKFFVGLIKKDPRPLPAFSDIHHSELKEKYFVRLAPWDWLNETMIHVADNHAPRMITMDPWPQLIFLEADGQKTVFELVYYLASKYEEKQLIPADLDTTVILLLNSLLADKLIGFTDQKVKLPYYLDLPKSKQDSLKAKKLMIEDGFLKE